MKSFKNALAMPAKLLREKQYMEFALLLLTAAEFLYILFCNLFLLRGHMDYDSSWQYLRAALMWQDKALFSSTWAETTCLNMDSSMLLTALLYGLTGDLLHSYGIVNQLILTAILFAAGGVLKELGCSLRGRLLCCALILCPFMVDGFCLGNDLGYFSCLLSDAAYYNVRVLTFFLILLQTLRLQNGRRFDIVRRGGTFVLCLLSGFSVGVYLLLMAIVPLLLWQLERMFIKNDLHSLRSRENLFVILCGAAICAGILLSHICGITTAGSARTWTSLKDLGTNLWSVFLGLLKLLSVLPGDPDIPVLSLTGLTRLLPLFLLFVLFLSVLWTARRLRRDLMAENGFPLCAGNLILIPLLTLALINVRYGDDIFESRYLLCPCMALFLLVSLYADRLDRTRLFSRALWLLIALSILGTTVVSARLYVKAGYQIRDLSDVTESVNEYGKADMVYFWGDTMDTECRRMRAEDPDRTYRLINTDGSYSPWGDYLRGLVPDVHTGPTLLVLDPAVDNPVPESIFSQYTYYASADGYAIYASLNDEIAPYIRSAVS